MNHLSENELVEAYYGELDAKKHEHLEICAECSSEFDRLKESLRSLDTLAVPERGDSYVAEVWSGLLPALPSASHHRRLPRWLVWAPAAAVLTAVVFLAGIVTEGQREPPISARARERVFLLAMSEHLERSQVVLTELLHSNPKAFNAIEEEERARDLLNENRLLRQTATQMHDAKQSALLEDLERVLLEIANESSQMTPDKLQALRESIGSEGLLFKVRITSSDVRQEGEKL